MKRLFLLVPFLLLFAIPSKAQAAGPTNFYVVTAVAANGAESVFSNEVNTTFAQGQHIVTLTWVASSSTVIGYNVYRGATSGGPYVKISGTTPVTAVTYVDTFVLPNAPSGLTAKVS